MSRLWPPQDFESRRFIAASGEFAYGRRDGSQSFGALTGGWDMREGRRLLSPYGRLSATRSELGAFAEPRAGPMPSPMRARQCGP